MAVMGDLVVKMGLDASKLNSGLNKAKGGVTSFASAATSLINPITAGFAAVAAGAASAGAAAYVFAGRISALADTVDQAAKTGLSGQFLQRLGYAADQSGVSVETLTNGMKKLTIAIGKADPKPFASIGVNLADLKTLNPEMQFRKIAEAISKLPTAAERAAAAVKVFGKSGIEMTGLFAGGMNDLNALLADAEALGIGISDEGLARAAAADDAIQRMKASFGALLDQLTVGIAPAFNEVATYITSWMPPLTAFMGKFNELPDKAKFIGDVFEASMDVAILTIAYKWDELLKEMASRTKETLQKITTGAITTAMSTQPGAIGALGSALNAMGSVPPRTEGQSGLQAAKDKLAGIMSGFNSGPSTVAVPSTPAATVVETPKVDGAQVAGAFGGLFEALKPIAAQIGTTIDQTVTGAKIKAGGMLGSFSGMFGGGGGSQKNSASALQKGSQEALRVAMKGVSTPEQKALKLQEKAVALMEKQLAAIKDAGTELVAAF